MLTEEFVVLLHFSTTSDEHQVCIPREAAEIIELAWSIVKVSALKYNEDQESKKNDVSGSPASSVLVRPVRSPITDLCCKTFTSESPYHKTNAEAAFTGVTSDDVAEAGDLTAAISALVEAIESHILSKEAAFAFIVLDSWDFQMQLIRETREKTINLPPFLLYPRLYSVQEEFRKWEGRHYEQHNSRSLSCASICDALSIPIQGVAAGESLANVTHRAGSNVAMLRSITEKLLATGGDVLDSPFTSPVDAEADRQAFLKEESKVLHLSGLAYDTTQSELESWFTQHGGRPIAFWTLRTPDQHKPTGIGFAIFATHEEARESLAMNGRLLADRIVRVSPSSHRILDRATDILTPFPPSKNRPRPGDWTCPSCGFSNFQRRTACFRCSYPASGVLDQGPYYGMHHPQMGPVSGYSINSVPQAMGRMNAPVSNGAGGNGGHVPFRAGDWSCQTCAYHNFARNSVCLKCSMPRQQQQQHQQPQQDMNGIGTSSYQGYDGRYRMDALSNDMARQML